MTADLVGGRSRLAVVGLLAMVLAIAALLLLLRPGPSLTAAGLAQSLITQGGLSSPLAERDWFQPGWGESAGVSAADEALREHAFRIGVQMVDLEIAVRSSQMHPARILAKRLEALLTASDLPDLALDFRRLARSLEAGSTDPRAIEALLETSSELARRLAETGVFREVDLQFGRWCEAGRLAARSANPQLLASSHFRAFLDSLAAEDWNAEVTGQIELLKDLLRPELESDLHLAAVETSFRRIIGSG